MQSTFLNARIAGVKTHRPSLIQQVPIAEDSGPSPAVKLPPFNGASGWLPMSLFEQVFGDAPTFESVGYKVTDEIVAPISSEVVVYLELSGKPPTYKAKHT
jgi:hypothetical protein